MWMYLKCILLSESTQMLKAICCMIPYMIFCKRNYYREENKQKLPGGMGWAAVLSVKEQHSG